MKLNNVTIQLNKSNYLHEFSNDTQFILLTHPENIKFGKLKIKYIHLSNLLQNELGKETVTFNSTCRQFITSMIIYAFLSRVPCHSPFKHKRVPKTLLPRTDFAKTIPVEHWKQRTKISPSKKLLIYPTT